MSEDQSILYKIKAYKATGTTYDAVLEKLGKQYEHLVKKVYQEGIPEGIVKNSEKVKKIEKPESELSGSTASLPNPLLMSSDPSQGNQMLQLFMMQQITDQLKKKKKKIKKLKEQINDKVTETEKLKKDLVLQKQNHQKELEDIKNRDQSTDKDIQEKQEQIIRLKHSNATLQLEIDELHNQITYSNQRIKEEALARQTMSQSIERFNPSDPRTSTPTKTGYVAQSKISTTSTAVTLINCPLCNFVSSTPDDVEVHLYTAHPEGQPPEPEKTTISRPRSISNPFILVNIKSSRLDGDAQIQLLPTDTIAQAKDKIRKKYPLLQCQRIFFSGKLLDDSKTVASYNLEGKALTIPP